MENGPDSPADWPGPGKGFTPPEPEGPEPDLGPEPPQPPPPSVGTTVYATVGPGFRISFHTRRGTRIRRLRAGRYRIIVRDRSRSHSFQLFGRGVNKRTRIRFAGTQTWSVTFMRGYS
mgnify:CR=1 FL=1